MPIYEYTCMKCNKDFEYLVLGREDSVSCPCLLYTSDAADE